MRGGVALCRTSVHLFRGANRPVRVFRPAVGTQFHSTCRLSETRVTHNDVRYDCPDARAAIKRVPNIFHDHADASPAAHNVRIRREAATVFLLSIRRPFTRSCDGTRVFRLTRDVPRRRTKQRGRHFVIRQTLYARFGFKSRRSPRIPISSYSHTPPLPLYTTTEN